MGVGVEGVSSPAVPGQAAAGVCPVQQQRTDARRRSEADHTGGLELAAAPARNSL